MPVCYAKQITPYAEFLQWQQFYSDEPWGENRSTWQLAVIGCILAQANAKKGKKFVPADFMCRLRKVKKSQTAEEMSAALRARLKR